MVGEKWASEGPIFAAISRIDVMFYMSLKTRVVELFVSIILLMIDEATSRFQKKKQNEKQKVKMKEKPIGKWFLL